MPYYKKIIFLYICIYISFAGHLSSPTKDAQLPLFLSIFVLLLSPIILNSQKNHCSELGWDKATNNYSFFPLYPTLDLHPALKI